MLEYRYDTQLFIEGENLSRMRPPVHHRSHSWRLPAGRRRRKPRSRSISTNSISPGKVLEYCAGLETDIVVEDMDRQERGLKG